MRESKSNTKQNHIFQLRSEITSMSHYRIPITPFEIKKKKSTTLSKWHIFVFCFIKGSKCNGPICSRKSWNQFSPYCDYTHRHTLTQKHTSQDHRSGVVEKEAGWTLSWESNGAEGAEMSSWTPPTPPTPLPWEALTACAGSAGAEEAGIAKCMAEAWQWLLMRDYKAISNTMKASGGPSVTTDGNK